MFGRVATYFKYKETDVYMVTFLKIRVITTNVFYPLEFVDQ